MREQQWVDERSTILPWWLGVENRYDSDFDYCSNFVDSRWLRCLFYSGLDILLDTLALSFILVFMYINNIYHRLLITTVEQRTRGNLQYAWIKVLLHSNYFGTQHILVQDS